MAGIVVLGVAAIVVASHGAWTNPVVPDTHTRLVAASSQPGNFQRVDGPLPLTFPADHGPHPDYQTEWWYYTGNLSTPSGRRFGYQLTFFRRALIPADQRQPRLSDWATEQVYMAHFALTDVDNQSHHAFEKLSRGSAGLAGAAGIPFRVWLGDWFAESNGMNAYRIGAESDDMAVDLSLNDLKGPVLQGDHGYSQKGPDTGNASMYYSLTHLESRGTIKIGNQSFAVNGLSWMDHEFSTSALAPNQIGWDWFAIQLNSGVELMLFRLRDGDGSIDRFSSGTIVAADGASSHLSLSQFQIGSTHAWRSPSSGATYPAGWHIEIPSAGLTLSVEPLAADQEMNLSFTYWEGAVRIIGAQGGQTVSGFGYVELTGYAASMAGQF